MKHTNDERFTEFECAISRCLVPAPIFDCNLHSLKNASSTKMCLILIHFYFICSDVVFNLLFAQFRRTHEWNDFISIPDH